MIQQETRVFVFEGWGRGLQRVAGVFSSRETASAWIKKHSLSGRLSQYVLDDPSFDRAQRLGLWQPSRPEHRTPEYIENFSPPDEYWQFASGVGSFEEGHLDALDAEERRRKGE